MLQLDPHPAFRMSQAFLENGHYGMARPLSSIGYDADL